MKVYRVLSQEEYYKGLIGAKSLKTSRFGMWANTERFVNLRRANDKTGKFFFFYLQDAIFFGREMFFCGYREDNPIIEIEVDGKTCFDYLVAGKYYYDDNSAPENNEHTFPELYLPSELVDEKIKNGEYRIIDSEYRKDIVGDPKENEREPHYLLLANGIKELIKLRKKLKLLLETKERSELMALEGFGGNMEKVEVDHQVDAEIDEVDGEIAMQIKELRNIYRDFANEHEKYMMLQQVDNDQIEK